MTATVSFHPTMKYLGPQYDDGKISYVWNGVSWHTYKTDCTLSFSGIKEDGDEDYAFSYVFAATAALLLASAGAGAYAVRQQRSKCGRFNSRDGDENDETMDYNEGEASIISTDESLAWTLPLSRSMKRLKSLFNESTIEDEQSPENFVEMEGQDEEIPEEEDGIEIQIYKHKRKSFIPRFFRRSR